MQDAKRPEEIPLRKRSGSKTWFHESVLKRDKFKCAYCGWDGSRKVDHWFFLSVDHLVPKEDVARRDDIKFIVTACLPCNSLANRYFGNQKKRGVNLSKLSRSALLKERKRTVLSRRAEYAEFWRKNVKK